MKIIKKLLFAVRRYSGKKTHFTSAVILAGGVGSRMGTDIPKQHLLISGKETVVHSMLAFEKSELINEIIVVCRDGEQELYDKYKKKYDIKKLTRITPGGKTRSESSLRGFEAADERCRYVAIHDAARCLITSEDIKNVLEAAYKHGAAIAATKSVDTLKLADESGFIAETLDREHIYSAQTPQVFLKEIYMSAAYSAKKDGVEATDDSSLVERLGFKVRLVQVTHANLKVTTPDDIAIAENILDSQYDASR